MSQTIETNDDVLKIRYRISPELDYEINGDVVTILKKQDHKIQKFMRKIKFRIPEVTRIDLDEKSSFVFMQIDGQRTVEDIAKLVDEKFNEQAHPLYENLLMFLNHIEVNEHYIERIEETQL